ncbi:ParB N-terminal domain-containing protein [Nocardia terpenica]
MSSTTAGKPRSRSNIIDLPISDVFPSDSSPRTTGVNASHVMLAASAEPLPPIVVHRETMQVIDGLHRLHAARSRGEKTIAAVYFEGGFTEAFVLAVMLNAAYGLPLSLADRRAATLRILSSYPGWSNRSIATITGISPTMVAEIRKRSTGESTRSPRGISRNGVRRSTGQRRKRAAELFTANPNTSVRNVASAVGISTKTAMEVRKQTIRR